MIGSLISIWYFGKRPFLQAAMFWILYLILMFAIASALTVVPIPFISIIFSVLIFVLLAHYWLRFPIPISLKLWVISFVIDILMAIALAFTFLSTYIPGGLF